MNTFYIVGLFIILALIQHLLGAIYRKIKTQEDAVAFIVITLGLMLVSYILIDQIIFLGNPQ
jgi:hypothetical protein